MVWQAQQRFKIGCSAVCMLGLYTSHFCAIPAIPSTIVTLITALVFTQYTCHEQCVSASCSKIVCSATCAIRIRSAEMRLRSNCCKPLRACLLFGRTSWCHPQLKPGKLRALPATSPRSFARMRPTQCSTKGLESQPDVAFVLRSCFGFCVAGFGFGGWEVRVLKQRGS